MIVRNIYVIGYECRICKHKFFLHTNHEGLGLKLTKDNFDFEFRVHHLLCLNKQTVELLGGIYEKNN